MLGILPAALTTGVILENGGTDAPNSVSACVASKALTPKKALFLASLCNFLGAVSSGLYFPKVAQTVSELCGLSESKDPLLALTAAMLAVLLWTGAAWLFSIPTSESHALMAAMGGATGATGGEVGFAAWLAMIAVAALSVAAGWLGGAGAEILFRKACPSEKNLKRFQIALAGVGAFLHGAQDGQKFMCILTFCLLGSNAENIPTYAVFWCGGAMALGTLLCGKKMLSLAGNLGVGDLRRGLAADAGGAAVLLLSTVLGLPVSTTHVKSASAAGAGEIEKEKTPVLLRLGAAWALTFPACAFLAKGLIILGKFIFRLA